MGIQFYKSCDVKSAFNLLPGAENGFVLEQESFSIGHSL